MRKIMTWMALGLLGAAQATPDTTYPLAVNVRFGSLYWVKAKTATPRIKDGRVLVPLLEACNLLALKCEPDGAAYAVNGQRLPIIQELDNPITLIPLMTLTKLAGQTVTWDSGSKTAVVSGGTGTMGWRQMQNEISERTSPGAAFYRGPLKSSFEAIRPGVPTVPLSVYAAQPLDQMTLFSRWENQTSIVGSLTSSTPDIPNTFKGCQGKTTCTLSAPRDALWVLAYLTGK